MRFGWGISCLGVGISGASSTNGCRYWETEPADIVGRGVGVPDTSASKVFVPGVAGTESGSAGKSSTERTLTGRDGGNSGEELELVLRLSSDDLDIVFEIVSRPSDTVLLRLRFSDLSVRLLSRMRPCDVTHVEPAKGIPILFIL